MSCEEIDAASLCNVGIEHFQAETGNGQHGRAGSALSAFDRVLDGAGIICGDKKRLLVEEAEAEGLFGRLERVLRELLQCRNRGDGDSGSNFLLIGNTHTRCCTS